MIESIRRRLLDVYLREASLVEASAALLFSANARLSAEPLDKSLLFEDAWALIEVAYLERRSEGLAGVLKIAAHIAIMGCALVFMAAVASAAAWVARKPGVTELAKRDLPPVSSGPVEVSVIALVVVTLWLVLSHAIR